MRRSHFARLRLLALPVIAATVSGMLCDGTGPNDSFKILFAPQTTISRGLSTEVTLTISHDGSIGATTLGTSALPSGVTAQFTPATIDDATESVKLTLSATNDATLGNGAVKITAKGDEVNYETEMAVVVQVRGDYAITFSPASVTMTQGETKTVTVGLNRLQQFGQSVSLAVTPTTTGMTTTLSPTSINASNADATSTLTISATTAALTGPKTFTVTGTTEGLGDKSSVLTVTVNAQPSIALHVAQSSFDAIRGSSTDVNVAITRINYDGSVSIAASGQPSGVTVSSGASVGTTIPVTFTTSASAPVGAYTITLTGSGSGVSNSTASFTLNVK
jgi:uncharacterized membrane protein